MTKGGWRAVLNGARARASLALLGGALAATALYSSCGSGELNIFRPIARPLALKSDKQSKLEEARVLMDQRRYGAAGDIVEPMTEDEQQDSNEARLLYAAAKIGEAGLDVWTIVRDILAAEDGASASRQSGGLDQVLNSFTDSVLGTGAERQGKIDALAAAIIALRDAPQPAEKKLRNTACLLAGLLAVPTVADAEAGITATFAALKQLQSSAAGGQCPDVTALDRATSGIIGTIDDFNLIVETAANCPFLDIASVKTLSNQVEVRLAKLKANADKGCATVPACPAGFPNCAALLPPCVVQALQSDGAAVAGDGKIAACEVLLNCSDPAACFAR